jgi:Na+/serine symporter
MFKNIPLLLLAFILALLAFGSYIPEGVQAFLYSVSLCLKSLLVFILPLLIFLLLFKTTSSLAKGASLLILHIFVTVILSNFSTTMISYIFAKGVHQMDLKLKLPEAALGLKPLFELSLPKWISNPVAMGSGLIAGFISSRYFKEKNQALSGIVDQLIQKLLKAFVLVLPLFVAGFVIKLKFDGVLAAILKDYAKIFISVAITQLGYIFNLYLAGAGSFKGAFSSIKNMLPAASVGFSAMSSAAALPLTLAGSEKNVENKDVAKTCIPATVSIHLVGDCIAIPIFAFAVLKNFGMPDPGFLAYLNFAIYFVLAKFSVAAIPGGGIIVMLPILEAYLGFSGEMMSLITALYLLFDPVITSANILGNGAFAKLVDRTYKIVRKIV